MSEPILELPGISVTRESITSEGREVAVEMIKGACVKENYSAPSAISLQLFKAALVASICWFSVVMVLAMLVALQGYLAYPNWLGDLMAWVDSTLGPATVGIFFVALCVAPLTLGTWFVFRKRCYFMVQLMTTEGILTAHKTRNKEQAEQVKQAIEEAMGESGAS